MGDLDRGLHPLRGQRRSHRSRRRRRRSPRPSSRRARLSSASSIVCATPSGSSANAVLEVGRDRQLGGGDDLRGVRDRLLPRDRAVEPAERGGIAAAGRGQRLVTRATRASWPTPHPTGWASAAARPAGAAPGTRSQLCRLDRSSSQPTDPDRRCPSGRSLQCRSVRESGAKPPIRLAGNCEDGSFRRQESQFRRWVTDDGSTEFPLAAGPLPPVRRPRLPVGAPDDHRAHADGPRRRDRGLLRGSDPQRATPAGRSAAASTSTRSTGLTSSRRPTRPPSPTTTARVTVPSLWDKQAGVIVSNESADILRMLGDRVRAGSPTIPSSSAPSGCRARSRRSTNTSTTTSTTPSTRPGSRRRQHVYEHEVRHCSRRSTMLDARLADRRFLFGPESPSRPTGACSRRWCGSTPSTRSTSSARSAS